MTRTRQPTARDVEALLAFLPRLYADGFRPVANWSGGEKEDGALVMPGPDYDGTVREFIDVIRHECWIDYDYDPRVVEKLIESEDAIRSATLPQIRAMLTYVLRGERFCDGHWGHMIEGGYVRRILERLSEIEKEPQAGRGRGAIPPD